MMRRLEAQEIKHSHIGTATMNRFLKIQNSLEKRAVGYFTDSINSTVFNPQCTIQHVKPNASYNAVQTRYINTNTIISLLLFN